MENLIIKKVIFDHLKRYKLAKIPDIVKLIYQNEFAGGHMIKNPEDSLEKLKAEISKLCAGEALSFENAFDLIGNGLCRVNLRKVLDLGISPETLNSVFVYTANTKKGSLKSLKEKLDVFESLNIYPCDLVREYLKNYEKNGFPPISHSLEYRRAYRPAYRIVDKEFSYFFDLFLKIDKLLMGNKSPLIVCIDGKSASGKSTLGNFLASVYNCNLFHADDFFLRPEQRTKERLKLPGGNLDYERITLEVFEGIKSEKEFSYRRYNCSTMRLEEPVMVTPTRLNIIEGAYSTHPDLTKYCNLKVFLSISPQMQDARIISRNGKQMHEKFKTQWIPKEETYFHTFGIVEKSDLFYDVTHKSLYEN